MTREAAGSNPARRTTLHHYCVVRGDVPLGVQAAQLVHAAGHSGGPISIGASAVVLVVADEPALDAVRRRFVASGLPHHAIFEPDPPWCGALMAIGVEPMNRRNPDLRRAVARLKLFGGPAR